MRRAAALAALALALLLAAVAPALAATPKTTVPDVEDEVMCTQCGTPLNVSQAPSADAERRLIRALVEQGKDKDEIKAALVAEYGPRVLAVPSRGGFDEAAWIVPVVLGILGLLGIAVAARRWRAARGPDDVVPLAAGPPLDPDDARRLDAELAAFDR